jgi:hypothetical protein
MNLPDFELLNEFRQTDARMNVNLRPIPLFQSPVRCAVSASASHQPPCFPELGWRSDYRSFSPAIELEYRPWAWTGPIFTLDYDRSIKGILHSNTGYERWELNGEYIHRINKLQSLQMRLGTGSTLERPAGLLPQLRELSGKQHPWRME